jgi:CheY-like chemotaxis protein
MGDGAQSSVRTLVVDDEDKILFVVRHALSRLGAACQVQTACDGRQALEMARDARSTWSSPICACPRWMGLS